MTQGISPIIKEKAPLILAEIKKAKSILLHCHPAPDPDSVGSALAMKLALEGLGKKATVIRGDSNMPQAFMHFPGAEGIVQKNFFEADLKDFDLFISLDSADLGLISRRGKVAFPEWLKVVNIDHHPTNPNYGSINLVEPSYPATGQVLFDLFGEWGIEITPDIAADLFVATYSDTGGLKYEGVTAHTYEIMTVLSRLIDDIPRLIRKMENLNTPGFMKFASAALGGVEAVGGKAALTFVPHAVLKENALTADDIFTSKISSLLMTVPQWVITGCGVEIEPNKVKFSFRSADENKYDVSKLATALGGGGHGAASGAILSMPLEEAKRLVVAKAKELYNL